MKNPVASRYFLFQKFWGRGFRPYFARLCREVLSSVSFTFFFCRRERNAQVGPIEASRDDAPKGNKPVSECCPPCIVCLLFCSILVGWEEKVFRRLNKRKVDLLVGAFFLFFQAVQQNRENLVTHGVAVPGAFRKNIILTVN